MFGMRRTLRNVVKLARMLKASFEEVQRSSVASAIERAHGTSFLMNCVFQVPILETSRSHRAGTEYIIPKKNVCESIKRQIEANQHRSIDSVAQPRTGCRSEAAYILA